MENKVTHDKLDLIKGLSQVESRIKKNITSDFILAKLDEKQKKLITETTSNAYFCKKIIEGTKDKKKWYWRDGFWEQDNLTEKEEIRIKKASERTFEAFMIKNIMIALLNRNVKNNHLVRLMTGLQDEEDEEEGKREKEIINKIKEQIKPNKEK